MLLHFEIRDWGLLQNNFESHIVPARTAGLLPVIARPPRFAIPQPLNPSLSTSSELRIFWRLIAAPLSQLWQAQSQAHVLQLLEGFPTSSSSARLHPQTRKAARP